MAIIQLSMNALVSLVETRDPETGMHIQRTQHYARLLAQHLKATGQFKDILSDTYIEMLFLFVPLHDTEKVGIPDRVLLKPWKLSVKKKGPCLTLLLWMFFLKLNLK